MLACMLWGTGVAYADEFDDVVNQPADEQQEQSSAEAPQLETETSPKSPWGEFPIAEEKEDRWWTQILLWVPNRFMDLIDVFRVDVGVGPAYGGVVRLTKYGQVGYREMSPASVRIGDFGRKIPFTVERSNEFGIGPGFLQSKDRKVCAGEIGVGADLFVGAYAGFCPEELVDFFAGLVFLDVMSDDMK